MVYFQGKGSSPSYGHYLCGLSHVQPSPKATFMHPDPGNGCNKTCDWTVQRQAGTIRGRRIHCQLLINSDYDLICWPKPPDHDRHGRGPNSIFSRPGSMKWNFASSVLTFAGSALLYQVIAFQPLNQNLCSYSQAPSAVYGTASSSDL
jgi:hypothetical protein